MQLFFEALRSLLRIHREKHYKYHEPDRENVVEKFNVAYGVLFGPSAKNRKKMSEPQTHQDMDRKASKK